MVTSNRRSKQFVDPTVQGALLRRMALHWFIFLSTSTILMLGLRILADPFESFAMHWQGFLQDHMFLLALMVCMTPIFLWDTVKLSNRFVGPVMRVHRAMRDLNEGREVQQVKLRGGDFWPKLADEFNRFLQRQQPSGRDEEVDMGEPEPSSAEAVHV